MATENTAPGTVGTLPDVKEKKSLATLASKQSINNLRP